jgi:hypothetical protein
MKPRYSSGLEREHCIKRSPSGKPHLSLARVPHRAGFDRNSGASNLCTTRAPFPCSRKLPIGGGMRRRMRTRSGIGSRERPMYSFGKEVTHERWRGKPSGPLHPEGVAFYSPGQRSGGLHPEGVALFSPGQRPGRREGLAYIPRPERARQAQTRMRSGALSGLRGWAGPPFPGRCPGLKNPTPSG